MRTPLIGVLVGVLLAIWGGPAEMASKELQGKRRTFTVVANDCTFSPSRLEVEANDQVKITFTAEDAPHSFVIDACRISKRATPSESTTFEFLANQTGVFVYYSNLATDERCPSLRGEFIVR